MSDRALPLLDQSPTDPDFVQNPYPVYARARRHGPMLWWDAYAMMAVFDHATVQTVLRDRRWGREVPASRAPAVPPHLEAFYAVEAHSMLELDPPRHTRLRASVLRAFTSRRIAALEPEITALCHKLIDDFPPAPFDLLQRYCTPLPVIVIARLLGVPDTLAPDLLRWSGAMVAMYQANRTHATEVAAGVAAAEFTDFLRGYVTERRARPGDDLITHLIAAEADGARLSTDELITTCILLLNAGHEASVHTLGNGVAALLAAGGLPGSADMPSVVEEILRYDPPLHLFTRNATQPVTLHGHDFAPGDPIALMLGSAGRDPLVFERPDMFDVTRPPAPHAAFGGGLHFCVGAPLARLEMQIALRVLFDRCPGLRLRETPRYADVYHFHGLEALRVTA